MSTLLDRLDHMEGPACARWNRRGDVLDTQQFFRIVSRLGDGVFWYLLMTLLIAVYGSQGVAASLHMFGVGLASLVIYKTLKLTTVRQRPFATHPEVHRHAPTLDLYSFPSGHTMHAVGFNIIVFWYFPLLGVALLPFTVLVALSRLILGLHYPSDVLVGATIGAAVALASLVIVFP